MSEIKNGGLDQYGPGPFEQHQFGTAGVEGVKRRFGDQNRSIYINPLTADPIKALHFAILV